MKTCKSMAAIITQDFVMQHVKGHLKIYLQPRELHDACLVHSIMILCGFDDTTANEARSKNIQKEVTKLHKDILQEALFECTSWQTSFLRFILVAIWPCQPLFFKLTRNFMDLPLLSKITLAEINLEAGKIHKATTQQSRALIMESSVNASAPHSHESKSAQCHTKTRRSGRGLCLEELWAASHPGVQEGCDSFQTNPAMEDLKIMDFSLSFIRYMHNRFCNCYNVWSDKGSSVASHSDAVTGHFCLNFFSFLVSLSLLAQPTSPSCPISTLQPTWCKVVMHHNCTVMLIHEGLDCFLFLQFHCTAW